MWRNRSITFRYAVYGALLGLLFPILSTVGDLWVQRLPFTLGNLLRIQVSSALHWVTGSAPFFLGLFAGLVGRRQEKLIVLSEQLRRQVQERDQAISQLEAFHSALEQQIAERTQDLERRVAFWEAATDVGRTIASDLEANSLTRQAVELIRERFGLYHVGLFLVDERREWAVLRAGTGEPGQELLARGHRIKIGQDLIGWSIANAQPRVVQQARLDDAAPPTAELADTLAEAALPLRSRGRVLGALSIQDTRPNAFPKHTIAVLQATADQVAVALDNALLFAEKQEALETLQRAHGEASRRAWKNLPSARSGLAFRRSAEGLAPGNPPPETSAALSESFEDYSKGSDSLLVALPIKVRQQTLGVVKARKNREAGDWTPEELELLQTLLEQVGVALENARLFEEAHRHAQRQQLVTDISDKIRAAPDMDAILRVAVQEIRKALGASHGVICLDTETGPHTTTDKPVQVTNSYVAPRTDEDTTAQDSSWPDNGKGSISE